MAAGLGSAASAPRHAALPSARTRPVTLLPKPSISQTIGRHILPASRALEGASNGAATREALSAELPTVKIDNQHDPFATIVTVKFGDKLGDLLDTIAALKNLGLNIQRAKLENPHVDYHEGRNTFFVTEGKTAEKVTSSERLEEIRMTILQNMMYYHPESTEDLGIRKSSYMAIGRDTTRPLGASKHSEIETSIDLKVDERGRWTVLNLTTLDRPGLLVDIVHILKDISVNVLSAEVDTIGRKAQDTLLVTYHGEPLNSSMEQLAKNALQYYLSLAEVARDESY